MMTNLKEWRKRRQRETKKSVMKVARTKSKMLSERLLHYAWVKGLRFVEIQHDVCFLMPSGALLTIYDEPSRYVGGMKPVLYYGEIFFPYRKHSRLRYLDERCVKFLYNHLAKAINEISITGSDPVIDRVCPCDREDDEEDDD